MADRLTFDLFCEDSGHEGFASALIQRLAREAGALAPHIRSRSTRGGHGRAITELRAWQSALRKGAVDRPGDALVVLIDGNGSGWHKMRAEVEGSIDQSLFARVAIGCPDPHVEAWCAADLQALQRLIGMAPKPPPTKPGRAVFKRWLREVLEEADEIVLGDPMDIAADLVPEIDLYAAGRAAPSLGAFLSDLKHLF